ncbi:hypothetical protein GQ600_11007 [Phytophthora cactorum]|nr:hypothetical protein GQ600_11007 [Phytophthora cactorum]
MAIWRKCSRRVVGHANAKLVHFRFPFRFEVLDVVTQGADFLHHARVVLFSSLANLLAIATAVDELERLAKRHHDQRKHHREHPLVPFNVGEAEEIITNDGDVRD